MVKILLLGSSGFIGKNLKEQLCDKYDINSPSHEILDVTNEEAVKSILTRENYDVVINALDIRNGDSYYFEQRLRMYANLEKYHDYYGKMIYFGSGAEYGRTLPIIKIEEKEFNRIIPTDSYGFCLHQMSKSADISNNIYNLRLFGIFGKYEVWKKRFISNAICKALFNYPITIRQNVTFDFLYIDDLCKIVEWMIEHNPVHHSYNAISGNSYSLIELANIVKQIIGSQVPILIASDGYGSEYTGSNTRLKQEMDFQPEPIEISIRRLTEWYHENIDVINRYELLYQ